MFGRKTQAGPTVIGKGTIIEGALEVSGGIQVDGRIDGQLRAVGEISIGPEGVVTGEVIGDNLTIGGRVEGSVVARGHLHMLATGHVDGDVRYRTMQVDRGAVVDGRAMQVSGDETLVDVADANALPPEASEPAHA